MTRPDDGRQLDSPLGSAERRAQVLAEHPELQGVIADLERTVTPEFHQADHDAAGAQRTIKRNQLLEISGSALVATLAIVGLARQNEWGWGAGAGVVAGLTAAFALHGRRQDLDDWLDNRRVAEELRSLYFTTLIRSADTDPADRLRTLRTTIDRIIAPEFVRVRDEIPRPATSDDRTITGAAWQVYLSARLRSQIEWMEAKRKILADRSRRFAWLQFGLLAAAALAGFAIAVVEIADDNDASGGLATWLGVIVAASAGLVSLAASADEVVAGRRRADNYELTIKRLGRLDEQLDRDGGSLSDVDDVEWLLLGEHRSWQRITREYHS